MPIGKEGPDIGRGHAGGGADIGEGADEKETGKEDPDREDIGVDVHVIALLVDAA